MPAVRIQIAGKTPYPCKCGQIHCLFQLDEGSSFDCPQCNTRYLCEMRRDFKGRDYVYVQILPPSRLRMLMST